MKRTIIAAAVMIAVLFSFMPAGVCFATAEVDYTEVSQIQALFDAEPDFYATMLKSLNADTNVESVKERLVAEGNAVPFRLAGGLYHLYDTPEEQLSEVLIQDDYYWVIVFPDLNVTMSFNRNDGKVVFASADSGYAYKDADGTLLTVDYSLQNAADRLAAERGDTSPVVDVQALYLGYSKTAEYIRTEKDEYIIPYVPRPDFSEFINGKIYNRRETVELLKKMYPPEYFKQGVPEEDIGSAKTGAAQTGGEIDETQEAEPGEPQTDSKVTESEQTDAVPEPDEAVAVLAAPDADAADAVTTGKEPNLLYDEETEPVDYTLLWVLIACAAALAVAAVVAAVLIAKKKKR